MTNGPEWFCAKRFGRSSAMPCSWQGWLVVMLYFAVGLGSAYAFANKPAVILSILIPATLIFLLVASRTTKGGW